MLLGLALFACRGDGEAPGPPPVEITGLDWEADGEQGSLIRVRWTQDRSADVVVEYAVDEGEWRQAPGVEGVEGDNERLLVGIPYGEDAEWRVVASGTMADGPTIVVEEAPVGLPLATVKVAEEGLWAEGEFLLGSINQRVGGWTGGTYWLWIVDRQGRVVWARPTPDQHWTLYAQVAVTGDRILYDEQTYWSSFGRGEDSQVHAIQLDRDLESIATPGLHHAFIQMPDETLVWGSRSHVQGTEALVQRAHDGTETILWTCADDWPGVEDCESNCVTYDADRDSFVYSFYTNSSVVEIDRATGQSLWWAGTVPGGLDFDPPSARFSWQHGLFWTDEGTLLLSTEEAPDRYAPDIWAREYDVDLDAGVLREVWSYDSDAQADTNGDTHRLPNGNTLHAIGSSGQIKEVGPDGEVLWHLDFRSNRLVGRVELITDIYALVSDGAR